MSSSGDPFAAVRWQDDYASRGCTTDDTTVLDSMMGIIVAALLGGSGGYLGAGVVQSLFGLGAGSLDGAAGILGGVLGGGVVGGWLARPGSDSEVRASASRGEANLTQILGGMAGGAVAGAVVQAVLGVLL